MSAHRDTAHDQPLTVLAWRVVGVAGIATTSLALLKLAEQGFNVDLVPTLQAMADYWENLTSIPAAWIEPYVAPLVAWLGALTGLDLHLLPHWKHVFFLVALIVLRDAGVYAKISLWPMSAVCLLVGLPLAMLAGIAAGLVPLDSTDPARVAILAGVPVGAFAVHHFIERTIVAAHFREQESAAIELPTPKREEVVTAALSNAGSFLSLGAVATGLVLVSERAVQDGRLDDAWRSGSPGLLALMLFVLMFGFIAMSGGADEANRIRRPGETLAHARWRSGGYSWGLSILATLIGLALFLLLNTVLSLDLR